ncbi:homogentisate 1,2-dioxygenase [Pseudoalteromonas tunicata]|uniref:Homogentisate 1,2-dioxygenase n=1 Tax=Pseudoalteromonas tunicata D2 TaxID=87626 RepID=A4C4V4_9GAMM|nr:homogentisate 1,2-dioxygenase [Pseudoalteromonas tunicata]ATC96935.1 homogentisate 1,2-dioxygenase [Pseudoalteromonas tunicata]AXT33065.1 homogentisate 1,2-dioxygenase [Pseudoalteromonas tunicata]EAR30586.1 Homogentisate 1,2-dioxygenase (Homogentisicase) (Homogentisate oxygenase) (Homogentisic acid oxidase) [Pseudoalteromonas tunicata D2]MDP4983940.1 homogentisate 1,2-dioxygenase [Pseudoalteromonas tunicata]
MTELNYMTGFGNEFETEALPGALPIGQFSPQKVKYDLYAEQFNVTAFTAPRAENRRNWFYRIRPSVIQGDYQAMDNGLIRTAPITEAIAPPTMFRWSPVEIPAKPTDFIDGLKTMAANGSAEGQAGIGIHVYVANQSMQGRYFYNADGELLFVPQQGALVLHTECGKLAIKPGEIAVIPRGIKFNVELLDESARGYICENYGHPYILAERGPVGANGYANDRDFQYPVAAFEDLEGNFELVAKFNGNLFRCDIGHSPLDVVAWTGNSAPYKYDLSRFCTMNTVSFDHPDPSIFTVLTSPSGTPGVANIDFVVFPPRWMVAEHTFRPPYYHRNIMSEFMGLIEGVYDAKEHGFVPGGMSLHNCMSPHGPEAEVFEKASNAELKPQRYENTMAFMFESRYVISPTKFALEGDHLQKDYTKCWQKIEKKFTGKA